MRCSFHSLGVAIAAMFSVPARGLHSVMDLPAAHVPSEAINMNMTSSVNGVPAILSVIKYALAEPPDTNHTIPLWRRRRKHFQAPVEKKCSDFDCFSHSAAAREWSYFGVVVVIFIAFLIWTFCSEHTHNPTFNLLMLFFWISVALIFNLQILYNHGSDAVVEWITGYFLEVIFTLDDIFIFASIFKIFRIPEHLAVKTLFITIVCQNGFQVLCYLGLATWLQSIIVLPYILGSWLIFVGIQMAMSEDSEDDSKTGESTLVQWAKYLFGDRLTTQYPQNYRLFIIEDQKLRFTLICPVLFCVVLFDLGLELDVTLAKMAEFDSHYIAYTSSALASFVVPTNYFLLQKLYLQFPLLKYGIAVFLFYFGIEILLHNIITFPDIANMIFMLSVMALSILFSYGLVDKKIDYDKPLEASHRCSSEREAKNHFFAKTGTTGASD